jgi:hypothetical protein
MDNQHRQIKGYRELDQAEIDAMNEVKAMGVQIGEMIDKFNKFPYHVDGRWLLIGKTHMQEGLMAITRSIARPDFF